jgi:hypothetical protein
MAQDTKKVQTLVNEAAVAIEAARKISSVRAKYVTANPSVSGTPLQGNGAAINQWLDDFEALLADPVADLFVSNKVASHRGKAL